MGKQKNLPGNSIMIRPPRQGSGSSKGVLENFPALGSFCPGFSETYPVHTFKRGKGARLYDLDGNRFLDFDLENGSLLFGHAPPFVTHAIKNALSLGNLSSSVNREITRFYSVLKHRFPEITGYTAHFLPEAAAAAALLRSAYPGWEPVIPDRHLDRDDFTLLERKIAAAAGGGGGPLLLDETESAFRNSPKLLTGLFKPEAAAISFCDIHLLLMPAGHSFTPKPFLPPAPLLAGASAFLKKTSGPGEPYTTIKQLALILEKSCGTLISEWHGYAPIIKLTPEQRKKMMKAGFLLPASGKIHLCCAHTEHDIRRLAVKLNKINE